MFRSHNRPSIVVSRTFRTRFREALTQTDQISVKPIKFTQLDNTNRLPLEVHRKIR